MTSAIFEVLPLAGVALSPLPIAAVIVMLFTPQGRTNAAAFLAGCDIIAMWEANRQLKPGERGNNALNNKRIDDIMTEYDLTVDEWHHWARHLARRESP